LVVILLLRGILLLLVLLLRRRVLLRGRCPRLSWFRLWLSEPRESILVVGAVIGHDECGIWVFFSRFQLRRKGRLMKK